MSITTTTTTQTSHRATLAGGITVSLDPAVFGATLTLSDTLRALTLTLTPEQVAEMGSAGLYPHPPSAYLIWRDLDWFLTSARARLGGYPDELRGLCDDDYDLVRDLARAYQETQP
jgi:hypothetical protein